MSEPEDHSDEQIEQENEPEEKRGLSERLLDLAEGAVKVASGAKGVSLAIGKAILKSPDQLRHMEEAGRYLQDVREIAGLTRKELSEAIDLADESLLAAVENGTATLSFELILRIAALLARHDPVPFALKFVRTYNPELWKILETWGADRIPLHYERERKFVNIYRKNDVVRELSDEGLEKILAYTDKAFDMALHFIVEQEGLNAEDVTDYEDEDEDEEVEEEFEEEFE